MMFHCMIMSHRMFCGGRYTYMQSALPMKEGIRPSRACSCKQRVPAELLFGKEVEPNARILKHDR